MADARVVGAGIDALAPLGRQFPQRGAATNSSADIARVSLKDREGAFGNPPLGFLVALVEEAPGRFPEVFEHMGEIDHEGDLDAAPLGFTTHSFNLVAVAVHQHDPPTLVLGVAVLCFLKHIAVLCFLKHIASHLLRALLHARPHSLVPGALTRL